MCCLCVVGGSVGANVHPWETLLSVFYNHKCFEAILLCAVIVMTVNFFFQCVFFLPPCMFFPGNCWFLAALSCLTMHPTLYEKVVPSGQTIDASYAGIFRFRVRQMSARGDWKFCYETSLHFTRRSLLAYEYAWIKKTNEWNHKLWWCQKSGIYTKDLVYELKSESRLIFHVCLRQI